MGVLTDKPPGVLLTTSDLEAFGDKYLGDGFIGVFARDQLNEVRKLAENNFFNGQLTSYAIINTDESDGKGKHWVALSINYPPARIFFFDSYGSEIPEDFERHFQGYNFYEPGWKFQGNPDREEGGIKSALCGFWVARALIDTKKMLEG